MGRCSCSKLVTNLDSTHIATDAYEMGHSTCFSHSVTARRTFEKKREVREFDKISGMTQNHDYRFYVKTRFEIR